MIATLIAYTMTAILFCLGAYGLYWTIFRSEKYSAGFVATSFVMSMAFFAAAYEAAKVGGI